MELECLLKKILLALALASCPAVAARAKQVTGVRVGPAAEEPAPENNAAARRDDGRAANDKNKPAADDEKKDAAAKKEAAAKGDPKAADGRPAATRTAGSAPASSDPPAVSSNNTKTAAGGATPAPQATSDGAGKASQPANVPVGAPRATLSAEKGATTPAAGGASAPNVGDVKTSPAPAAPANPNTLAAPPAPAPTSIYKVGVGDVLDIRLHNVNQRESTLFTVMPGGLVDYPLAGDPFNVSGMTTDEIAVRVAAELRRRAVFERPQVFVSVREYASHTVLVSGLVGDPGVKILRREAVPLYVLVAEAQPKPEAGRAVIMSHATGQTRTVDLTDAQGMATLVYPSDVVNMIVRPQEFYYVGGEVASPGQKDFHTGLTLTQALLASGGATRAAGPSVRVSRQGAGGLLASNVYDLNLIRDGKIPDPLLQPGDRIEVSRAPDKKK